MTKSKLIFFVAISIAVIGVVMGVFVFRPDKAEDKNTKGAYEEVIKSDIVGMSVKKHAALVQRPLKPEEQKQGRLWQFVQPTDSQQEFAIDANYEQGDSLKKLTGYTKQSLRDSTVTNINLQLPKQYPGYKELTQRNLTINGIEANETIFEYTTSGVRVKQRLVLFAKNSDTAVYIRAQARAAEYDQVNGKYFEPIFSSVKFE